MASASSKPDAKPRSRWHRPPAPPACDCMSELPVVLHRIQINQPPIKLTRSLAWASGLYCWHFWIGFARVHKPVLEREAQSRDDSPRQPEDDTNVQDSSPRLRHVLECDDQAGDGHDQDRDDDLSLFRGMEKTHAENRCQDGPQDCRVLF